MQLTIEQVQRFLTKHYASDVNDIVALSGGNWSQAFGFKSDGRDLVVRFGQHEDFYLTDKAMAAYDSDRLPIPKVLEVGKGFDGYYAISERAFGVMIDDLDKAAMRRVIPSLFATLDAIRETDTSHTVGFGQTDKNGKGAFATWYDKLLDIATDEPSMITHGWKKGLSSSPVGIEPFEESYAVLKKLARDLPEVRSLVHNDLLNFNVLVNNDKITALIDWANAFYGDFLYDLAQFTFWGPLHTPVQGIDWEAEALKHYQSIGLEVPEFGRRLRCCMIHMGLDAMAYYGYTKDWTYLAPVAERTLALSKANYA